MEMKFFSYPQCFTQIKKSDKRHYSYSDDCIINKVHQEGLKDHNHNVKV